MKNNANQQPSTDAAPESPERAAPVFKLTLSTPLVIIVILLMASPWLALSWFCIRGNLPASLAPSISIHPEGHGVIKHNTTKVVQGPWGTLKIEPIIVEPPSTFFGFDYDASPSRRWIFGNASPEQVRSLLARSGLDAAVVENLMKTAAPDPSGTGQILRPPDEIIRKISPKVRAALYFELGKNPANVFQATPFKFRGASVSEWFANSELPGDIIAKIQPLVYMKQHTLYFSDLHLVLPEISSPLDRIRLLQTLHRAATYSLHLEIKSSDSLDAILAYWGRGGRRYDIEPILKSMHSQEDEESLDVTYLLPGFARTRLYTYINPTRGDPGVRRDCHWTSFNFFNDIPDDRYGRLTDLTEVTSKEYEGINSPMEFGDIIFFIVPPKSAIHSCVYIADDIVFTKNGVGFGMPFVFEHLDDVIAGFREDAGDFSVQYCRRRGIKD